MKVSLRTKLVLLIVFLAVILSMATLIASNRVVHQMTDTHYKEHTAALSESIAMVVDGKDVRALRDAVLSIYDSADPKVSSEEWGSDEWNTYIARFSDIENMPEYESLREVLRTYQDINGADSVYIICIVPEDKNCVYLVDASDDPCPPGCFDPLYEMNYGILSDPAMGFPPYITDTEEYGWLTTAAFPIYDGDEIVSYCAVDTAMESILSDQAHYMVMIGILLFILTAVVALLGMTYIGRSVIRPVKQLSNAARAYASEDAASEMKQFVNLNIHTKDEIEELADSMKRMEQEIHDYYTNLLATKQELSSARIEAEAMNRMAYFDEQTGVRNKRSYSEAASSLDTTLRTNPAPFAIAMIDLNDLKHLNDTYGHDKGDIAIDRLCGLICRSFRHSPVFRVGGDEFVALLQKSDYQKRTVLIDSFRKEVNSLTNDSTLEPWEKVSAAIGYADYDPENDTCVEDVMKRADSDMYEHKREMKAKAAESL